MYAKGDKVSNFYSIDIVWLDFINNTITMYSSIKCSAMFNILILKIKIFSLVGLVDILRLFDTQKVKKFCFLCETDWFFMFLIKYGSSVRIVQKPFVSSHAEYYTSGTVNKYQCSSFEYVTPVPIHSTTFLAG